jgi:hypothetical protein
VDEQAPARSELAELIHGLALRLAAETERAHLMSDPDVVQAIGLVRLLHPLPKTDPASYLLGYVEAVRRGR